MSPTLLPAYDKQVRYWRLSKDVLGSGTTSIVVRATHVKLPTICAAVKIISRSGLLAKAGADPTSLHLADSVIYHEVLLMKLTQHERIVRLYDFFGSGDLAYIIMEHAPHKTLFDLFRASRSYLPRSLVTHIFAQFIQGLAYAHALHVVHRDLKLENIFLFGPDVKTLLKEDVSVYVALNVKIGDFGLAHVDDPGRLSTVFHGSPHYQAPEIWSRVPHRPLPTDIWSAGIVLYALICRRLPFDLTTLKNVIPPNEHFQHVQNPDYRHHWRSRSAQIGEQYMLYDGSENLYPAADNLLRKIFAYDPTARPTARGMLWDYFFEGLPQLREKNVLYRNSEFMMDSRVELYDLATLCVPPGRHVPRDAFVGSALERAVKDRIASPDDGNVEREWVRRLNAYEEGKHAWEASVEAQVAENRRKRHTRSLGRKVKVTEVLEQKEANLAVPRPKLTGSLSFCTFRSKAAQKASRDPPSHRTTFTPTTPMPASSTVAGALQDRREALLRRAYELGFRTEDLRTFADEANLIVHVAREGSWKMGLEEIAREVEKRAASNSGVCKGAEQFMMHAPACTSGATTLVSEKVGSVSGKHGRVLDVPLVVPLKLRGA